MSEYTAMAFIVFFKSLVALSAVIGAIYLAYHGKDGWGWMIFLAICLGSGSVHLNSENETKKEEVKSEGKF